MDDFERKKNFGKCRNIFEYSFVSEHSKIFFIFLYFFLAVWGEGGSDASAKNAILFYVLPYVHFITLINDFEDSERQEKT